VSSDLLHLKGELHKSLEQLGNSPCMVHSDISRLGFPKGMPTSKRGICAFYEETLLEGCSGGLIIPTFNYGFCRDGVYDVAHTTADVGVLSEYFRKKYPSLRTQDPIFSTVCVDFAYQSQLFGNCFGQNSIFGSFTAHNGALIFLGASFSNITLLHFVEELLPIGYRYTKQFAGKVTDLEGIEHQAKVDYRVRPAEAGAAVYDFERLKQELVNEGLLVEQPLGSGSILMLRAQELIDYWRTRLSDDEFFLLTPESRQVALRLYEKYGHPLPNIEGRS